MTFFNKKEDVIKIELTPHGRKLLSQGKLKPSFYTFLDDDILYDGTRGGLSENNSEMKDRILSETPYLKPQTNYKGIDSSKSDSDNKTEQAIYLQQKIGTNITSETRAAGWNVTALLGEITSSSNVLSGASEPLQPIPQLEFDLEYTMSVANINDLEFNPSGFLSSVNSPSNIKNDGSYVNIESEQILLNIFERNGFFHKDSYEIEVYLYEQDELQIDRKLKFFAQDRSIENNMLIDDQESPVISDDLTPEYVEYYLNIATDKQIPNEDICRGLTRLKAKDIFLDIEVECPDRDDLEINIYGSRVTEEDLEDC